MELHKLYNNEVELEFDPVKHTYTYNGEIVVSATGVTGIINKPALVYWAVNQTVEFLQKVLQAGQAYDELQLKSMLDGAKMAHRKKSAEAADIGTLAHSAIEKYIKTGEVVAPVNEKAKTCFNSFINWAFDNKVEFFESERKIFSKEKKYAGTMDFRCKIGDKNYIGDTKTSTGIYDEYWFQVAGYRQAYEEETGEEHAGQIIVRVGKDGSFEVGCRGNDEYLEDVKAFNGALVLHKRLQQLKDNANSKTQNQLNLFF